MIDCVTVKVGDKSTTIFNLQNHTTVHADPAETYA